MRGSGRQDRNNAALSLRELTLEEVRAFPRIPSGYVTERVFRLRRYTEAAHVGWELRTERLDRPLEKEYDNGAVDDWLEGYQETAAPGSMRFLGAFDAAHLVGLTTYTHARWNNTLWLADIRVRRALQRHGVGSYLLKRLQEEAASARVRGIRLETQISNYPAIQFYRKHGFELCGVDDHLYSNRDLEQQEVALFLFWERT